MARLGLYGVSYCGLEDWKHFMGSWLADGGVFFAFYLFSLMVWRVIEEGKTDDWAAYLHGCLSHSTRYVRCLDVVFRESYGVLGMGAGKWFRLLN